MCSASVEMGVNNELGVSTMCFDKKVQRAREIAKKLKPRRLTRQAPCNTQFVLGERKCNTVAIQQANENKFQPLNVGKLGKGKVNQIISRARLWRGKCGDYTLTIKLLTL